MAILLLACYSNFSFLFSLFIFPLLSSLLWGNIFTSLFGFLSVAVFLFSFYIVCSKNFCHICFHLELCDKGTAGSNSDDNDHIDFYFERATFILLERGEDWEIAPTSCRGTYRTPRSYFSLFLKSHFFFICDDDDDDDIMTGRQYFLYCLNVEILIRMAAKRWVVNIILGDKEEQEITKYV